MHAVGRFAFYCVTRVTFHDFNLEFVEPNRI